MPLRLVYEDVSDLAEQVNDPAPLREYGGCIIAIGHKLGLPVIVFDERKIPGSKSPATAAGGPVVVWSYGNEQVWRRELRSLLNRLDAIPATRQLGDWDEDGGTGIPILAGGPPPARGPGRERARDEALELPRNP